MVSAAHCNCTVSPRGHGVSVQQSWYLRLCVCETQCSTSELPNATKSSDSQIGKVWGEIPSTNSPEFLPFCLMFNKTTSSTSDTFISLRGKHMIWFDYEIFSQKLMCVRLGPHAEPKSVKVTGCLPVKGPVLSLPISPALLSSLHWGSLLPQTQERRWQVGTDWNLYNKPPRPRD